MVTAVDGCALGGRYAMSRRGYHSAYQHSVLITPVASQSLIQGLAGAVCRCLQDRSMNIITYLRVYWRLLYEPPHSRSTHISISL